VNRACQLVPRPEAIRPLIQSLYREARVLRALLRLAEQAHEQRRIRSNDACPASYRQEVAHER
jgi:hypothetical protein